MNPFKVGMKLESVDLNRDFQDVKRIVVKIGTSVLTKADGRLDKKYMDSIARQINELIFRTMFPKIFYCRVML